MNAYHRFALAVAAAGVLLTQGDSDAGTNMSAAAGQRSSAPAQVSAGIVTTQHQINLQGKPLRYTARAGTLPILDNTTGEVHANMYFSAYIAERQPGHPPRPVTFLWNGGPGSNSALVHLVGFGPRRFKLADAPVDGIFHDDNGLEDNQETWLDQTDLVFIDPIGTGYSRPTKLEYEPEFFQTKGDAESVAEFIRVYRNRFGLWDAPLIEGGESYGVIRAAWVAEALQRREITVSGVVLIGWEVGLGDMSPDERHVLSFPSYTAAAFYHKKLAPELQVDLAASMKQAEQWAQTEYLAAMKERDKLTQAQRDAIVAQIMRFTGFQKDKIDAKTLNINTRDFSEMLLADRKIAIGRYDSRQMASSAGAANRNEMRIPIQRPASDAVERYIRSDLQYNTDLQYTGAVGGDTYSARLAGAEQGIGRRWNRVEIYPVGFKPMEAAMRMNPKMKIYDACGYYDLGANCVGDAYVANQIDPALGGNITVGIYGGGHAIYTVRQARAEMKRDFAAFLQSVLSPPQKAP